MMKQQRFSVTKRLKSFKYAFNGLRILIREEHNARIHVLASVFVLIAGICLDVSLQEWVGLVLSIGFVFSLEIINSAIENIADFISPERHQMIKKIKDLSAAGVLVSAATALLVGLIVFIPKVLILW